MKLRPAPPLPLPSLITLYFQGLAFGLVPALFVGPVLFTLLAASLQQGFGAGARVALGIALSDGVALALVLAGLGPVLTQPWGAWILGLAGGLILLGFGLTLGLSPPPALAIAQAPRSGGRHLLAGFAVNFINPFVFAFWVGAVGSVSVHHGSAPGPLIAFFSGTVTTILLTDLAKAAAAAALQRHLGGPALLWARRVSGLLLGLAGLGLALRTLWAGWPTGAAP